jgi:hypothetical protein
VNSVAYKAIEGVLSLEKVTKLERPVVFTEGVVNNAEGKVMLQAGRRQ